MESAATGKSFSVILIGTPSVILGQDQDTCGGGFNAKQPFVGDLTDVHLWDKEVSLCDVSSDMQGHSFTPGQLEKPAGPHKWHCVWTLVPCPAQTCCTVTEIQPTPRALTLSGCTRGRLAQLGQKP